MSIGNAARIATAVTLILIFVLAILGELRLSKLSDIEIIRQTAYRTGVKALSLAVEVDPGFCEVKERAGIFQAGYIECLKVPLHLFINRMSCDDKGEKCRGYIDDYLDCRDYDWNFDLLLGTKSPRPDYSMPYSSVFSETRSCDRGWNKEKVKMRLSELGLSPAKELSWGSTGIYSRVP